MARSMLTGIIACLLALLAGEHMDQFESFETKRFVQRLLGKGDVSGLMDKIQDVIPEDKQPELIESITKVCLFAKRSSLQPQTMYVHAVAVAHVSLTHWLLM